jgi:hypothetical protein
MGHSEGAIAVATLDAPPVAARIIEGWTCHAGWPEYRGLAEGADRRAAKIKCRNYLHGRWQVRILSFIDVSPPDR